MSDSGWLLGSRAAPDQKDFSEETAFTDHKIAFAVHYARGKNVLDLGSVQHNPEYYRSRYWLHRALAAVAGSLEGLDLYAEGVDYLRERGFNINLGDAQNFQLGRQFDVIIAGDLIEHLENFDGFFESCRRHLRPGGKLLISTPNPWYWRNIVKAALRGDVSNNPEHTCWLCPRTLNQLAGRHGMRVSTVVFGSRYLWDRLIPLPKGIKHTSFHAVLEVNSSKPAFSKTDCNTGLL